MKKIIFTICLVMFAVSLMLSGCADGVTGNPKTDTAILGGLIGAGAGQAFGGDTKATVIGGLIGAGGGYIAGQSVEKQQQKQTQTEQRLNQLEQAQNQVAVKIKNSNDSTLTIILVKDGVGGYYGPKGEHYDKLPTEEQLRSVYGF